MQNEGSYLSLAYIVAYCVLGSPHNSVIDSAWLALQNAGLLSCKDILNLQDDQTLRSESKTADFIQVEVYSD